MMVHSDEHEAPPIDRLREVASDERCSLRDRRWSILQIFKCHISNGMTLGQMVQQLGFPALLRDEDVVLVQILAGKIPVRWSLEDTIFAVHILPTADSSPITVYLRIAGTISKDEFMSVLRGHPGNPALADRTVVEVGYEDGGPNESE